MSIWTWFYWAVLTSRHYLHRAPSWVIYQLPLVIGWEFWGGISSQDTWPSVWGSQRKPPGGHFRCRPEDAFGVVCAGTCSPRRPGQTGLSQDTTQQPQLTRPRVSWPRRRQHWWLRKWNSLGISDREARSGGAGQGSPRGGGAGLGTTERQSPSYLLSGGSYKGVNKWGTRVFAVSSFCMLAVLEHVSTGMSAQYSGLGSSQGLSCLLLSGFFIDSLKGPGFTEVSRNRIDPLGTSVPVLSCSLYVNGAVGWAFENGLSASCVLINHYLAPKWSEKEILLSKDQGIIYFQWLKSKEPWTRTPKVWP